MPELPVGTVTFLFTDMERSTESAIRLGDESFAEQLEIHRRLLFDAFAAREGLAIGLEGDALFVAFARAGDAVVAALDGQRAIEGHRWPSEARIRVRMGLHTADAIVRNGEYIGRDVHKAKRICDAGHGGQILVSEATAGLVASSLPEGASLTDLGHHRLKDLGDPLRIYQVSGPDLPHDFAALRSLESFRHNLPEQRSTFIGRHKELADVRKLLEKHRIVTLTGIGGCGKTRLSLQTGAEELDGHADGVFFVELAALSDPDLLPRAVAEAIGMNLGGSLTGAAPVRVEDLLTEHLERKNVLLILDNCEHLLDACARLADSVVSRCPYVTLLATSREPLDIEGEQTWPVPPLSLPEPGNGERSEAVALFRARAQAVQPAFELTDETLPAVAEICRRLDGLPLAIELAASRVTHLSPAQIAARLDDMFRLLSGHRRRVPRQQTLQASLDWSYDLLGGPERTLLRRLAIFAGSFGVAAVEEVCSGDDLPEATIVEVLGSLIDKSLVRAEQQRGEIRYRLLEPVRLYAAGHLEAAGEAERFRDRHRDRYLRWVDGFAADEATFGFDALRTFETEHDNLRAALEWSASQGRDDLIARTANRLLALWWIGGHYDEGHRWLSAGVRAGALETAERVAAYAGLTACSVMRVDDQTREHAQGAIDAAGGSTSPHLVIALSLGAISSGVRAEMSRDAALASESRTWTANAIEVGETAGPAWKAFALLVAAQIELILGGTAQADRHLRASFDAWKVPSINIVAGGASLAVTRHILGDHRGCLDAARAAAEVEREWWRPGMAASALGLASAGAGDLRSAGRHLGEAIRSAVDRGNLWLNEALIFAGAVAFLAGDPARASRLMAAGRHIGGAPSMATPFRTAHSYALYLHYVPLVRGALGPAPAHRTRVEGRAMSVDEAAVHALEGLDT